MTFDRSTSAGFLVNHVARLFFDGLRKQIEPMGITPGQFPALLALSQQDGQTQGQLVEQLAIEQATMANRLNRMERDGLIGRQAHPSDGRAKIICLTEKAHSILETAYAAATDVNEMGLSDLTAAERDLFIGLMQRVIRTMQNSVAHPQDSQ